MSVPVPATQVARPPPSQPVPSAPLPTHAEPAARAMRAVHENAPTRISDWPAVAGRLPLTGIAQQLALQSALISDDEQLIALSVAARGLSSPATIGKLEQALASLGYRRKVEVRLDEQAPNEAAGAPVTAHQRMELERTVARQALESAVQNDPVVREIQDLFGASVISSSIRAPETGPQG
jgi:DNA polymerase III subunit gamma/tau